MLFTYSSVHTPVLRPFPAEPRVSGGIHCGTFSDDLTLEDLRRQQRAFVEERDWARFHTPRSLALALVGEVGELCEVLQWRGDDGAAPGLLGWSDKDRTALTEELADVLSYVLRIADVCDIDLPTAYADKLAKNRAKYPAELVRGSSAKYTEYRQGARAQSASEASAAAAAATTPPQPAVPLPSPSPPPLEEPFDADEPYARAARRVEAQSRAYARAQKRAADKWAALQAQGRTDAMGSEKAMPASWADSGAAPASAYAGGRTGARTDESSAVAVAQEASRDESAAMSAAKAAEAEKEAEMEVQQVEKEAEMAQRIQSLRERAISRAEAQWAARQARQTRQASPTRSPPARTPSVPQVPTAAPPLPARVLRACGLGVPPQRASCCAANVRARQSLYARQISHCSHRASVHVLACGTRVWSRLRTAARSAGSCSSAAGM